MSHVPVESAQSLNLGPELLSVDERKRVLSGARLKIVLIVMVVLIIAANAGLVLLLVSNIFDFLTPTLRRDLEWKAQRGAAELSRSTELGVAAEDPALIAQATRQYTRDSDVLEVIVVAPDGSVLNRGGRRKLDLPSVFANKAFAVVERGNVLLSWAPVEIKGVRIGMVGIGVSMKRLQAGMQLRRDILAVALGGALLALLAALAFVNLYIGPLLRVTEQAFLRLEQSTELALAGSRLKSQFLANMSHEIRTPMNGVLGITKLILDRPLDAKVRRYVETIDASGRALLTIINDILDFSKIEAGKYKLSSVDFDPVAVTEEAAELLSEPAHRKQVELVCRIATDVPTHVKGDPDRYRQVLTNLVGNAVKFTSKGEVFIDVKVGESNDERVVLHVDVRDTGIGITEAAKSKLFEAFSQEDGASARAYGGTGLGLAISKRLLELMGGSIEFSSVPDVGSRFWFTLPVLRSSGRKSLRPALEPAGQRALIVDANGSWRGVLQEELDRWGMVCVTEGSGEAALRLLRESCSRGQRFDVTLVASQTDDLSGQAMMTAIAAMPELARMPVVYLSQLSTGMMPSELPSAVVAHLHKPVRQAELYDSLVMALTGRERKRKRKSDAAERVPANGTRILVVEDNDLNQFVAAEQLKQLGYTVGLACNGLEAVEAVAKGGYAAVLMDCQMPVMDGYEAAREIRRREAPGTRIPIIALTAHALLGEREKVLEVGMDDYLTKPMRPDIVRKVLAQFVTSREAPSTGEPAAAKEPAPVDLDPQTERSDKVIELFLRLVPGQLAVLEEAIAQRDMLQARAHAHKLKGSASSIGAQRMAQTANELQCLADGELDRARALFATLRERFETVRLGLNEESTRAQSVAVNQGSVS